MLKSWIKKHKKRKKITYDMIRGRSQWPTQTKQMLKLLELLVSFLAQSKSKCFPRSLAGQGTLIWLFILTVNIKIRITRNLSHRTAIPHGRNCSTSRHSLVLFACYSLCLQFTVSCWISICMPIWKVSRKDFQTLKIKVLCRYCHFCQ